MKYQILQSSAHDCGFCVLKVMLANLQNDRNYLYLQDNLKRAYSMLDLKKVAAKYKVELQGYHVDDLVSLKEMSFPLMCQIKRQKNTHFILINAIDKKGYHIFDPAIGELILEEKVFSQVFMGNVLKVVSFQKNKLKNETRLNKYFIGSLVCNLVLGFTVLLSLLWMSREKDPTYFIIMSLSFFLLILLNVYFNNKYLDNCYQLYDVNYQNVSEFNAIFKKNIMGIGQLPLKCLLVITISFMIIESTKIGIYLLAFVLAFSICSIFFNEEIQHKFNKITFLESMETDLSILIKKGRRYAIIKYAWVFLFIFLNLGLLIFSLFLSPNSGIDYVLFNVSLNLALFKLISDITQIDLFSWRNVPTLKF